MWRIEVKGNLYGPFFDLLKSVYHLNGPPTYTFSSPLFDSWDIASLNFDEWEVIPEMSDADHNEEVPSQHEQTPELPMSAASQGSEILITSGDSSIWCGQAPDRRHQEAGPSSETTSLLKQLFAVSDSDETAKLQPEKSTCRSKLKSASKDHSETRKQKVCHPKGFEPESDGQKGRGKVKHQSH